jgi:hypothetical protein
MVRRLPLVSFALLVTAAAAFPQSSAAIRGSYDTHNEIAAYGELGLGNLVSVYAMPGLTIPRANAVEVMAITAGIRFYPFDLGDLGYPGYPRDRNDFGHQLSPFLGVAAQGATVTATDDEVSARGLPSNTVNLVLATAEVGLRWYLFRSIVVSKSLLLDNLFLEIPIGYSLNVSSLTRLFGYGGQVDDALPPLSAGLALGMSF